MELTPTGITADRATSLLSIDWSDGSAAAYPFDLLRSACPCAQCRGGHENMSSEPEEDVFIIPLMNASATELANLEPVGNYALNITWADGHSHGIYTWKYLLSLGKQMEQKEEQE